MATMRQHRNELERILRSVDGMPLIIDASTLARKACGIINGSRPSREEIVRASIALKDQWKHPMYDLKAKEMEGHNVRVMFWRDHGGKPS